MSIGIPHCWFVSYVVIESATFIFKLVAFVNFSFHRNNLIPGNYCKNIFILLKINVSMNCVIIVVTGGFVVICGQSVRTYCFIDFRAKNQHWFLLQI